MQRLLEIGFNRVGDWRLVEGKLIFSLDVVLSGANVLYAFVSGGVVLYIGKTTQTLPKRLMGYQRPGASQTTNTRNNIEIKILLALERNVEIYALADTGLLRFGEFTINLAAGLEDALISELKPAWNCR